MPNLDYETLIHLLDHLYELQGLSGWKKACRVPRYVSEYEDLETTIRLVEEELKTQPNPLSSDGVCRPSAGRESGSPGDTFKCPVCHTEFGQHEPHCCSGHPNSGK